MCWWVVFGGSNIAKKSAQKEGLLSGMATGSMHDLRRDPLSSLVLGEAERKTRNFGAPTILKHTFRLHHALCIPT